jgi:DNA-binding CsgD family transcriptional regulator
MGKILHRMLRRMGLKRLKRAYRLDLNISEILEHTARKQARDPEEVAAGFLNEGLTRLQQNQLSFAYWSLLTPREKEVIALVCLGYLDKEIAGMLGISYSTVKKHVDHAMSKAGARQRGHIQWLLSDWDFNAYDHNSR